MKKVLHILSSHLVFFILATTLILSLNLAPFFLLFNHTPSDRVFSMVHNNIQDFYFYQALMQQGASGQWLTTDPFTLEPHEPSIIFAYFLWLGKLSKLVGMSFPIAYHLTRITFGVLAGAAAYILIRILKLPHPKLTYLFFLFAGPFLKEVATEGGSNQVAYMYWWTGIDAIRRFAYLPHHVFGSLFLIVNVISLMRYVKTQNKKWLIVSIFCALLLGFVHPPSLFILLLTLPIAVFIYLLPLIFKRNDDQKNDKPKFILPRFSVSLLVYWFIGLLLMLLMVSQTNKGFPWSQYIAWEKNIQFPLDKELVGALGILFPFAVIGGVIAIVSGQFSYIFVACWMFVPFAFIPFAQKLNISNIRLIQGTPYLPLAILAIIGIQSIQKAISQKWVTGVSFALFLLFTIPTLAWSVRDQVHEYWNIWSNVYLDKRLFPAFEFINSHFPAKTNTMSTFYTGNYLAAFTHTNSFMGHFGYTYNREKKEADAQIFFKNEMTLGQVKSLLSNNKITLIFQGVEEKPLTNGYLYPDLLKVLYDENGITIYGIK